ncbi:transcriptional modulator of MazE/toxin MazF [Streptococcus suis]|uniref:type II toxin-antitoxin system PemK/MazF family toxin n=1 Tax=Streptococcus suis TaxID=1307 RepID=UPI000768B4F9|nr:type II toxin-antitoxin system PemK/MazF family toxin [Streptococcus suis]CYW69405.1 transcriptional modulator of MazE/toxin MazF [Streptococcus suis]
MTFQQGEVYLVNFTQKGGNEFYGKHYAIILTPPDKTDGTLLAVPLTGKKQVKSTEVVSRWIIPNTKTHHQNPKPTPMSEKYKKLTNAKSSTRPKSK